MIGRLRFTISSIFHTSPRAPGNHRSATCVSRASLTIRSPTSLVRNRWAGAILALESACSNSEVVAPIRPKSDTDGKSSDLRLFKSLDAIRKSSQCWSRPYVAYSSSSLSSCQEAIPHEFHVLVVFYPASNCNMTCNSTDLPRRTAEQAYKLASSTPTSTALREKSAKPSVSYSNLNYDTDPITCATSMEEMRSTKHGQRSQRSQMESQTRHMAGHSQTKQLRRSQKYCSRCHTPT